ncbi:hypothetical protein VTN77DRAFT_9846 [Rasamsonia byssochlamydoides]|uniref:uncharacterized protein n=1 Tax=Rasamsonia byssochlamydoides TaxID=89139 RepID=UPI0037428602
MAYESSQIANRVESKQQEVLPAYRALPVAAGMPHGCTRGLWDSDSGKPDELGTLNLLTPEVVLEAKSEIQLGISVAINWPLTIAPRRIPIARDQSIAFSRFPIKKDMTMRSDSPNVEASSAAASSSTISPGPNQTASTTRPESTIEISVQDLAAVAVAQGTEFRHGVILLIRSGFVKWHNEASLQQRIKGTSQGTERAGLVGNEEPVAWLWDHHLPRWVAMQMSSRLGRKKTRNVVSLHDNLISLFGMPLGEMFDLEGLAEVCKRHRRWSFFFTSTRSTSRVE